MRTNRRAIAAVLLVMAVVSTVGCISTELDRAKRRGKQAVIECEDAYKDLYLQYKNGRVDKPTYEKGKQLYFDAQKVATDLTDELDDATREGDKPLAAPGRKTEVAGHIARLKGLAGQIRGLIPGSN